MEAWIFDGWAAPARTLVVGVLAYVGLVFFLRISGRRTLSKMNAFDLVVTISLGSTLASVLLSKDVVLVQGLVAFATLIGLQFLVTWSSVRASWVREVVTGQPALLLYRGQPLTDALRRARVNEDELRAAVRGQGQSDLATLHAVVLETDGSFTVIPQSRGEASGLKGVSTP